MNQNDLIEQLNTELEYLDTTITNIIVLRDSISNNEPDIVQKAAMNQFISEFYNGIENILKRICKYSKVTIPHGGDSHINLFNFFIINNNEKLPVLFNSDIENEFIKIRKFRHFVIHGYSFKVEWSYLKDSVNSIDNIYQKFKKNVLEFIKSIQS
jgi:hypothetical protein